MSGVGRSFLITLKYYDSNSSTVSVLIWPHPFCKNSLYIMYYTEKRVKITG